MPRCGNGRDFQDLGNLELCGAVLDVLLQNVVEESRGPPARSIAKKSTLPLRKQLGTLSARAERRVIGDVAEKVEGIGVRLAGVVRKFLEGDAALFKRCDDGCALIGIAPARAKLGGGR